MREKLWRGMPVSIWTEVQKQNKAMFQPRGKTAMGPGKVSADVCILLQMINSSVFIRCVTGMMVEINTEEYRCRPP